MFRISERICVAEGLEVLDAPVTEDEIAALTIDQFNEQLFLWLDEYQMPEGGGGGSGVPPIDEWPRGRGGRPEPKGSGGSRFGDFARFIGRSIIKCVTMQGFNPESAPNYVSNHTGHGPEPNKFIAGAIPEQSSWLRLP